MAKKDKSLTALYSGDLRQRERAARKYKVFPDKGVEIPSRYQIDWQRLLGSRKATEGKAWPASIAKLVKIDRWPEQAFGTANAACLLVWHRPGLGGPGGNPPAGAFIGPPNPVLGGIPHAQNVFWNKYHPSPSWRNLHKYLPQAFDFLESPWSQIMIACLNPEPSPTGKIDRVANMEAVRRDGRMDEIAAVCRPKVVVACGKQVREAISSWSYRGKARILNVSHPLKWGGHGGQFDGPEVVKKLRVALQTI